LQGSPLYIVDKTIPWPAVQGADGKALPRVAGVSSFGFGGANVHIVLEEYIPVATRSSAQHQGPYAIVLSAKNEDRLKAYAQSMLTHIDKEEFDLADFAYTLQVGRNPMIQRLGFVVNSIDQLKEKLQAYVSDDSVEDVYHGRVSRSKSGTEPDNTTIEGWFASKNLPQLLNAWIEGAELDWSKLYNASKPKRISLPTYPFARERYWFGKSVDGDVKKSGATTAVIHPLVHRNTSVMRQQRYSTIFSGKEKYLSDHEGQKVLPALAYLEMAHAAITNALPAETESGVLELRNIHWLEPIVVAEDKEITIALFENDSVIQASQTDVHFEIHSAEENSSQDIIHCQGSAYFNNAISTAKLDIQLIKDNMANGEVVPQSLYAAFAQLGR
ncbi:MAG: type I polyketide synthase, partial [Moraxellaceae bacterium]